MAMWYCYFGRYWSLGLAAMPCPVSTCMTLALILLGWLHCNAELDSSATSGPIHCQEQNIYFVFILFFVSFGVSFSVPKSVRQVSLRYNRALIIKHFVVSYFPVSLIQFDCSIRVLAISKQQQQESNNIFIYKAAFHFSATKQAILSLFQTKSWQFQLCRAYTQWSENETNIGAETGKTLAGVAWQEKCSYSINWRANCAAGCCIYAERSR